MILWGFLACQGDRDVLSAEELMDPQLCASCHPVHYEQWSSSMHAYAGKDPVFRAMNTRGQRETGGELGAFCVNCHAPLAVRFGETTDGTDLDDVPEYLQGVTCYYCHSVQAVEGDHNNPLVLADDGVMRGGIGDPVENEAHLSSYSPLHDRQSTESSALCGACHDIITPAGVHLERTYAEWQESLFSRETASRHLSCAKCHMVAETGPVAASLDAPTDRDRHEHLWPGVDVAFGDFPGVEMQKDAIQRDLDAVLYAKVCADPAPGGVEITVTLDNVFAGHSWPSGASADRRAWLEVVASLEDTVRWSTGEIAAGEAVAEAPDPDLWQIRDTLFGESGEAVHMFWDAREITSEVLTTSVTSDPSDPAYYHAVSRTWAPQGFIPDMVSVQVHLRPMGLDVLDDLIATGDLDAAVRSQVPTFSLAGTAVTWHLEDGYGCVEP